MQLEEKPHCGGGVHNADIENRRLILRPERAAQRRLKLDPTFTPSLNIKGSFGSNATNEAVT